jgi:hypothetical protein
MPGAKAPGHFCLMKDQAYLRLEANKNDRRHAFGVAGHFFLIKPKPVRELTKLANSLAILKC